MDMATAFDEVARITSSAVSVTDGMHALIDFVTQEKPGHKWSELRSLDYQADSLIVRDWLKSVLTKEPPSAKVKAYWFGIFNPIVNDEASCGFYLMGSTEYTPDDFDWACWDDDSYLPKMRYAPSQVLPVIYRTVMSDEDEESLGEYTLCLGYVALVVAEMARSLKPELFLGKANKRVVAVGYDEGDGIVLGVFNKAGWEPAV